jgi:hypothetical protein
MLKRTATIFALLLIFTNTLGKDLPLANQKVVDYVKSVMGTQVGNGECTELIMSALFAARSANDKPKSKAKSKDVLPGDIISFYDVEMGGLSFPQHTAIIMEVESQEVFTIAHQNHNGNKTVQLLRINLKQITQGTYSIQHP